MLRLVDTPLAPSPDVPTTRPGGIAPALLDAMLSAAPETLAKLAHPDAVVVTSGQQPGLFTGPLYTIHKALSARGLALELERRWNRPVVPVFWLAGDDHDYAEGASTTWFGPDGALVTGELAARAVDAPMTPLYRDVLPPRVEELLAELGAALTPSPARDETLGWLGRHYRTGATMAGAYGGALAELLRPLGVVCFDPTRPSARRAAAPLLIEAASRAAELDQFLGVRSAALEAAGAGPDVKVGDGATLVFLDGPAGRDRLVPEGSGFRTRRGRESVSMEALRTIAKDQPERISGNVLLRPVVESALLPTVAYIAGPGELRYLRLAEVLYQPLGVPRQAPVARWSGLLVEPRVDRALEKFGATIADLMAGDQSLEQRTLRGLAPADFDPAFGDLRGGIEATYQRIAEVARLIDPTLEKTVQSARSSQLGSTADLEKRLLQAQKRRQGELITQLDRVRNAVRPRGAPQERVIGLPALAGRYGLALLEPLADHIAAWFRGAR